MQLFSRLRQPRNFIALFFIVAFAVATFAVAQRMLKTGQQKAVQAAATPLPKEFPLDSFVPTGVPITLSNVIANLQKSKDDQHDGPAQVKLQVALPTGEKVTSLNFVLLGFKESGELELVKGWVRSVDFSATSNANMTLDLNWIQSHFAGETMNGGLGEGTHSITASYSGDAAYNAAVSSALAQTISAAAAGTLVNLSTRGPVLTGNDVMIGGFIIGGSTSKTVVVRARGPSLAAQGVPNALANPVLSLFSGQTVIASNDDWQTAANSGALQSSGFAPSHALESAVLVTLAPGAYTAIVSGVGGLTGVGMIEVFEVDHPEIPLVNISTRGKVLTGSDVMIGGFIVQGNGPQTVVVRARGPSMSQQGVPGTLANPMLQLIRSSDQAQIAVNDNWGSASNAAEIAASGFAPPDSSESAILITLQPGAYTAIVTGVGGATGVGLVEVFRVQ